MSKLLRLWLLVALLCVATELATVGNVDATEDVRKTTDWKNGKLSRLAPFIGTFRFEQIFEDPHVKQRMQEMLGDDLAHFMINVDVRVTIDFQGSEMVLSGARAHEAHRERAILIVDIYNGKIHAGIFSEGQTTIYSKETVYAFLPGAIRQWVRSKEITTIMDKPPTKNFNWVR